MFKSFDLGGQETGCYYSAHRLIGLIFYPRFTALGRVIILG
jgi:hypothetical protein